MHFSFARPAAESSRKSIAWRSWPPPAGSHITQNPTAPDTVSFHLWAAYAGLESWSTLAQLWHAAKGDPADEQRVTNTTGGEPYELPGEAPAWEELKARAEGTPDAPGRPRGIVPIGALLLTIAFDCQDDYVDGVVIGWGSDLRRWIIERVRVEGHISTPEAREELNKLVDRAWPTAVGSRRRVDLVGIDAGFSTDDVHDWARNFPRSRVIMLRGVGGDAAPALAPVRKERRRDGRSGQVFWAVLQYRRLGAEGRALQVPARRRS